MIGAILSPIKINVQPREFDLLIEFTRGEHKGKYLYVNPTYVQMFCRSVVEGENSVEEYLTLYRNEIEKTDKFADVSGNWISSEATRVYSLAEVQDFQAMYDLSDKDAVFSFLEKTLTDDGDKLSKLVLLAGIDIILDYEKRSKENVN